MDELEARVRCLELAASTALPDRDVKNIVVIATEMYNFAKALPEQETEPVADKSKRVKKAPVPDIMS